MIMKTFEAPLRVGSWYGLTWWEDRIWGFKGVAMAGRKRDAPRTTSVGMLKNIIVAFGYVGVVER